MDNSTPIPFLDLSAQYATLEPAISEAMQAVINANAYIRGPFVERFEQAFAEYNQAAHCIGVANGTDSLFLALKAAGIGAGHEVLVPATTFVATSEAVTMAGARPVFVDVDPETYTLNPALAREKITDRTRAIIAVHLYGHPADMVSIASLADEHGLFLLQDAAQAHGATLNGHSLASFGHCLSYSFYPGKNLGAYGDAGGVVTDDEALAEKVRMWANHGRKSKYDHEFEGVNSRMDGFQGAVLSVKLPHLDQWISARRKWAKIYDQALAGVNGITPPKVASGAGHAYHLYVVQAQQREELQTFLASRNISTGIHYPIALPYLEAYAQYGHTPEDFPVSHSLQSTLLSLPIFPELGEDRAQRVARAIAEFYS